MRPIKRTERPCRNLRRAGAVCEAVAFSAVFCWCAAITTVAAGAPVESNRDVTAGTDQNNNDAQLPPLPALPPRTAPVASAVDLEELDGKLSRLKSPELETRREAMEELLSPRPRMIAAALARFSALEKRADRERLKRALTVAKDRAKRATRGQTSNDEPSQDLLPLLVTHASPKDDAWRDIIELIALSRIFVQIGTIDAARGLIEIYVHFGEFLRVDVQNRLFDLKDAALAALIEARRHKAEKIATWAERQLDRLGKAVPGEAIRTSDPEILADILRAYGRTKDPDAARIVVTYANNDRHQVREAARQAVVMMGDVALWQLREAYEDVVGKRARRDFTWERTARELFFEYDKLHHAKVSKLYDEGKQAESRGDLKAMRAAYDAVLAQSPRYERAEEMALGYFAFATKSPDEDPAALELALSRVLRLTKDATLANRAQSLRDTLAATQLFKSSGVFDAYLLNNAAQQDPANQQPAKLLTSLDKQQVDALTTRTRYLTSGAIGTIALLAIGLVLFRRNPNRAEALPGSLSPLQELSETGATSTHTAPSPITTPVDQSEPLASPKAPEPPSDALENDQEEWRKNAQAAQVTSKPSRDPFDGL